MTTWRGTEHSHWKLGRFSSLKLLMWEALCFVSPRIDATDSPLRLYHQMPHCLHNFEWYSRFKHHQKYSCFSLVPPKTTILVVLLLLHICIYIHIYCLQIGGTRVDNFGCGVQGQDWGLRTHLNSNVFYISPQIVSLSLQWAVCCWIFW